MSAEKKLGKPVKLLTRAQALKMLDASPRVVTIPGVGDVTLHPIKVEDAEEIRLHSVLEDGSPDLFGAAIRTVIKSYPDLFTDEDYDRLRSAGASALMRFASAIDESTGASEGANVPLSFRAAS